ncbi:MAG: lipid-A-disaccharide synthase [Xanthomonadales bacterium]|nr:lipid-A-disaccharide synthase [Xanthomonadales bacterium]
MASAASDPVILVAGEASGDALGAGLIEALLRRRPEMRFAGIGGPKMAAAGMDIWFDCEELAVMGLSEVVSHLPRLLKIRRETARRTIQSEAPLLIGIDAPDFNLGLERRVRGRGVRTIHYVSPSIWAWRQGRARTIGECAELVLALFPFEPELYRRYGATARFVGHPLADRIPLEADRDEARAALGLPASHRVVALLPGSRRSEVNRLAATLATTAQRLAKREPDLCFVVPAANARVRALIDAAFAKIPDLMVRMFDGQSETVLTAADVAVIASGTATLEGLLTRTPMVVVYRVSTLTYWLVKLFRLMKVERYSLPNYLAGEGLVDELMQADLTTENLTGAVQRLLGDEERRRSMRQRFREIHELLRCDADEQAADAVLALLERTGP